MVLGNIDKTALKSVTRCIVVMFSLLWITGLLLLLIDTRFDFDAIMSNSKLVLKLVCVVVLTLNSLLVHFLVLKIINRNDIVTRLQSIFVGVVSAISTSNWLLAGFVGSSNELANYPIQFLLISYSSIVLIACFCALMMSSFTRVRLNVFKARAVLTEMGIRPEL